MHVNAVTVQTKYHGVPLELVDQFTQLANVVSNDNSAQKDIKARIIKERCAFNTLKNIW